MDHDMVTIREERMDPLQLMAEEAMDLLMEEEEWEDTVVWGVWEGMDRPWEDTVVWEATDHRWEGTEGWEEDTADTEEGWEVGMEA